MPTRRRPSRFPASITKRSPAGRSRVRTLAGVREVPSDDQSDRPAPDEPLAIAVPRVQVLHANRMSVEPRYEPIGAPHRAPGEPHHRGHAHPRAGAAACRRGRVGSAGRLRGARTASQTSGVAQCGLGGDGQLHRRHPVQRVPHHDRLGARTTPRAWKHVRSLDDGLPAYRGAHPRAVRRVPQRDARHQAHVRELPRGFPPRTSFAIVRHVPLAAAGG